MVLGVRGALKRFAETSANRSVSRCASDRRQKAIWSMVAKSPSGRYELDEVVVPFSITSSLVSSFTRTGQRKYERIARLMMSPLGREAGAGRTSGAVGLDLKA